MANYKVSEATISQTPVFSSFEELIRENLTKKEVETLLNSLLPYLDPDCFNVDNPNIEFEYFGTTQAEDEEDDYRFVISKVDVKSKK